MDARHTALALLSLALLPPMTRGSDRIAFIDELNKPYVFHCGGTVTVSRGTQSVPVWVQVGIRDDSPQRDPLTATLQSNNKDRCKLWVTRGPVSDSTQMQQCKGVVCDAHNGRETLWKGTVVLREDDQMLGINVECGATTLCRSKSIASIRVTPAEQPSSSSVAGRSMLSSSHEREFSPSSSSSGSIEKASFQTESSESARSAPSSGAAHATSSSVPLGEEASSSNSSSWSQRIEPLASGSSGGGREPPASTSSSGGTAALAQSSSQAVAAVAKSSGGRSKVLPIAVGASVGGFVLLVCVVAILVFVATRRRRRAGHAQRPEGVSISMAPIAATPPVAAYPGTVAPAAQPTPAARPKPAAWRPPRRLSESSDEGDWV